MKITTLLSAFFALLVCATPALAQTSSPEDRQRFVTIVHKLEKAPLDAAARGDRAWAIQWITDAPDVSVTVCSDLLGNVVSSSYAHRAELTVQYVLGMGAFVVEHPDKANDADAVQLAGVESALAAYRVMRAGGQSPAMETLVALQDHGELPGFTRDAFAKCRASGG
jgi:hypothetical protein